MKRELIVQLHTSFEQLIHVEEETGVEFWLARDLQKVLGYETWRSFERKRPPDPYLPGRVCLSAGVLHSWEARDGTTAERPG